MSNYSINQTFEDSSVNAGLDRIYYELEAAFPEADLDKLIGLTGRAAKVLQGVINSKLDNVIFLTNDLSIYSFFQTDLPQKIQHNGVVKFKERTLYYFPGFYFEIWYSDSNIGMIDIDGIIMQDHNKINNLFL
jgi:hypothetical protein